MRIAHPQSAGLEDHRGFTEVGQGHVSQLVFDHEEVKELRKSSPERKETLEMGNPHPDAGPDVPPNRWLPEEELPGFRAFIECWWDACTQLNHALLRRCSEALNLPSADYLSQRQARNICHMSFAYYPQTPVGPLQNRSLRRLNAHTDFGQLTLLFQDMVGGLEIHDGNVFRPVIPRPGTVVINVGDLLEHQTNGRWKSALHQVVAPRELMGAPRDALSAGSVVDRFSLIYFGTPDPDSVVETLPGCNTMGRWKPNILSNGVDKITAAEWVQKRLEYEFEASA
jgi:isopenicillin N synthase-like dioxygenase